MDDIVFELGQKAAKEEKQVNPFSQASAYFDVWQEGYGSYVGEKRSGHSEVEQGDKEGV